MVSKISSSNYPLLRTVSIGLEKILLRIYLFFGGGGGGGGWGIIALLQLYSMLLIVASDVCRGLCLSLVLKCSA